MKVKAVIFDFIGTLVNVVNYSYQDSLEAMHRSLVREGLKADFEEFYSVYKQFHQKYRQIRHSELKEVTNAVWLAEALNALDFKASPEDPRVKKAINVFFRGYLKALKPKECAAQVLRKLSRKYKLGLISNFTYSPRHLRGPKEKQVSRLLQRGSSLPRCGLEKTSPPNLSTSPRET